LVRWLGTSWEIPSEPLLELVPSCNRSHHICFLLFPFFYSRWISAFHKSLSTYTWDLSLSTRQATPHTWHSSYRWHNCHIHADILLLPAGHQLKPGNQYHFSNSCNTCIHPCYQTPPQVVESYSPHHKLVAALLVQVLEFLSGAV
jgi:hypothetical protein